jgi:hypothetical protein
MLHILMVHKLLSDFLVADWAPDRCMRSNKEFFPPTFDCDKRDDFLCKMPLLLDLPTSGSASEISSSSGSRCGGRHKIMLPS